jgi:hypothetical protein
MRTARAAVALLATLRRDGRLTRHLPGTAGEVAFSPVGGVLATATEGIPAGGPDQESRP